jgi:hypothetical protein
LTPRTLRLGDLGPSFTENLETLEPTLIKGAHIRRIAVVELFENITHG